MVFNYLKSCARSLGKEPGYALLNGIGLAIGIAASILILSYVAHELSYDDFHEKGDRIYRVRYDYFRGEEQVFKSATTFPKVGPSMKADFPEVEEYARLYLRHGGGVVRTGDRSFREDNLFNADSSFFSVFSFPLIRGDAATVLAGPNKAVIAEHVVEKYFGDDDPIGKRIRYGQDEEYEISGIARSPETSHIKFSFLFSYETLVQQWGPYVHNNWGWYDFYNYVLLSPGADPHALEAKLPGFVDRHGNEENESQRVHLSLQPLGSIHLHSDLIQEARVNGSATSVYVLALIAVLVTIIAWVNYVNLSTARAMMRAREIGIRKVVGARRIQLIGQFLLESVSLNFLAGLAALGLVIALVPVFNDLTGSAVDVHVFRNPLFWMAFVAFFVAGSLASGLYPAIVLSSFRPAAVLGGSGKDAGHGLVLRKVLVIGQFVASVGLIAATLVIFQQLQFMRSQELGVEVEQKLIVRGPAFQVDSLDASRLDTYREELLKDPSVRAVAASSEIPGNLIYWTNNGRRLGDDNLEPTTVYRVAVGEDYFDVYDHRFVAGRAFSRVQATDQDGVILNVTAVSTLGFASPGEALDDLVVVGNDTTAVIGVVADYHQEGLQKRFNPIAFYSVPGIARYLTVDVAATGLRDAVNRIGQIHATVYPDEPFTHFFLDDHFDRQYASFDRFGRAFGIFATLAILVACLGLFGLSSFATARRTKEIGIRKVLGSSIGRLVVLMSRDHLRLVLIASAIAVPLVWILMQWWLNRFAFRIDIGPWIFAAAVLAGFVIAGFTVGAQTLRAALSNPVDALRSE